MSDAVIRNGRDELTGGRPASPAEVTHEPNTVSTSGVVKFIVGLFVAVVVIALLVWVLLRSFDAHRAKAEPPAPALARGDRLPPEPRLQGAPGHLSSPAQDIGQFREKENQLLHSYGWIDQQNGIVRIPVEQAKKLIVQRGLSMTPQTTAQPQSGAARGAGARP